MRDPDDFTLRAAQRDLMTRHRDALDLVLLDFVAEQGGIPCVFETPIGFEVRRVLSAGRGRFSARHLVPGVHGFTPVRAMRLQESVYRLL